MKSMSFSWMAYLLLGYLIALDVWLFSGGVGLSVSYGKDFAY